jgi:vanillate/3-O-methylgallate O-demethylase
LRDIGFNRGRTASLAGVPLRVLRTGISGELGYELHGPADAADRVWRAVAAAGGEFGLHLLGFRAQPVQHIEAGIATNGLDYLPAAAVTPGAPRQFKRAPSAAASFRPAGSPTTSASRASWAGGRARCPATTSSAATPSPPTRPPAARPGSSQA